MRRKFTTQDVEKGKVRNGSVSAGDDPSVKIWNLSLAHAKEHDADMVDRWKGDMDGILIYTGVFSATVAAFLIESYKYLKPDPTDVTSKLLRQVTQELASISNGDRFSPPDPEPFQVQRAFIHVNILWFLSLCLSLACGLLATLVQQWLRRYIRLTRFEDEPIIRVRFRTFLYKGLGDFHVSTVVENVPVLLHAATFLFFAGLIEFLFAFNDEVADVVLVAVSIFAAFYILITFVPYMRGNCPFQTPLTTTLWYFTHLVTIYSLQLFKRYDSIMKKINKLWDHYGEGYDRHLLGMMKTMVDLDEDALKTALTMCRDDNELEVFMDAIPGYVQMECDPQTYEVPDIDIRISNIRSLLKATGQNEIGEGSPHPSHHRLVNLFASCTNDHRRMDEGTRRRRAIVCSRAIWEVSRVSLSIKSRSVALNLPKSIRDALDHLAMDHNSDIKASALRTKALLRRALLEHPAGAEAHKQKDHHHFQDIVTELQEVAHSMTTTPSLTSSSSNLAEKRIDRPLNKLLTAVTDYISDILEVIPNSGKPSPMDLKETKLTLKALCRELHGRDLSHADQEHLSNILHQASETHEALEHKDRHTSERYHAAIKDAIKHLVSTLDDKFAGPLRKRGY